MKTCNKCKVAKEYLDFHKNKDHSDGYASHCRDCRSTAKPKEEIPEGFLKCSSCLSMKEFKDFTKDRQTKSGYKRYCRKCAQAKSKISYKKDPERFKKNNTTSKDKLKQRYREYKESYPCEDCNIKYPWYVMDFDHLRDKLMDVSLMVANQMAWKRIEEEIAKCDLVCSNCHRKRTFMRIKDKETLINNDS